MKKLWLLFFGQMLACYLALGQQSALVPARVVTSYALTSFPDFWQLHPSVWRLLASNDGQVWTELDFRTNQPTLISRTRRVYSISNKTAFRIYRLQVDANQSNTPRETGLAEFELMGPVVGVDHEADLQANISSSQELPVLGAAINAFDGDATTKWMDYAPFKDGGCWIQCEYVRRSELLMTNVSQIRSTSLLLATPTLLLEHSAQILSTLNASGSSPARTLTGYALTSANDSPSRDPSDWRLLGSNDGGKTWETVDVRRNEIFSTRLHRRIFKLSRPSHFALYRLVIRARVPADAMQLASLDPLYSDPQKDGEFSTVVSASGENPPMEKTEMAFDHGVGTKWLCFTDTTNDDVWLQWQCLPKVEGLPLINLDQLRRLVNRGKGAPAVPPVSNVMRSLASYSLVSANDESSRDPADWRLLGSTDGGKSWETLDVERGQKFPNRYQRRAFSVADPKPYALYRLEFDSVQDPKNADAIQLEDFVPQYAAEPADLQLTTVVSARGENPYLQSVEKLFDGNPTTKWLDFSPDPNRASWVQWYFLDNGKRSVIRANPIVLVQPRPPQILKIDLEGVVVCADSNLLGFLDTSGFQTFQFESSIPKAQPGDQVRFRGCLQFGHDYPLVQDPELVVVGRLPKVAKLSMDQPADGKLSYVVGSAEGRVVAIAEGQPCTTVRLVADNGGRSSVVKIFNPHHVPLSPFAGRRIRARGVVEPSFDELGQQQAGIVWAADVKAVEAISPAETMQPPARLAETNQLTSIHQVIDALKDQPESVFNVKVRGVITFIDLGLEGWYLQNGPDAIQVQQQFLSGVNPFQMLEGKYVEVEGIVGGANGPDILPTAFIKVFGKGRMPEPLRHSLDYLASGVDDGRWVQLEGVVTAFERQRITLRVNGGQLVVWVNETDWKGQDQLLGSLVRVSGVCSPIVFNRQRLGVRLLVPSADWVEVIAPSPANPFSLPSSSVGSLLQPNLRPSAPSTQLRKITGVVTYRESQMLFVQTNSEALRVFPRDEADVVAGDVVEVVGIAEPDGLSPKLVQAVIRKIGRSELPAANAIDVQQLDSDDSSVTSQDATRGSVQATLVGLSANESVQILELQQEASKVAFRAYLPRNDDQFFSVPTGSRLRLEGAFKAKTDKVPDFGQVVTSFEMYLNSADDIVVLERPSWWTPRHTLWLLGGFVLVLFAASTWIWSLRVRVHRRTRELHVVIAEHEQTEVQLQAEISERKRMEIEVEKTHKALVDSSRQAGMAEVATSVLHNVGNVLNSVNVASSIVAENLHKSSSANLTKVVALINEHAGDLGTYITSDPKGRLIPSYLAQLSALMEKERTTALSEVDGLRQNIEHIKEIVAMQQTYARVAGVAEKVDLAELVDEALRTNTAMASRNDVNIFRDFEPRHLKVTVDKHKVLQILVNIIGNAKHACHDADHKDRTNEIFVRIRTSDQRVRISVSDNGIGILPENLTKIFNHGFTTRKDGHGFGLHSGALAAREMGGSLTATSAGANQGATFTLELPLVPANGAPIEPKSLAKNSHAMNAQGV